MMNNPMINTTSAEANPFLAFLLNKMPVQERPYREPVGTAAHDYAPEFIQWIRTGTPSNSMIKSAPASGGYTVPDTFEDRLLEMMRDECVIRRLATVFNTESGIHNIPLVMNGGQAAWVQEEGVIPESDPVFDCATLSAHKLGTTVHISGELLQDSAFDLESYILSEFARRFAGAEEAAFINGDGEHKPYGLLHPTRGATVGFTAESPKITGDDLMELEYSLPCVHRKNAIFLMNDSALKQIRKLKNADGLYLWDDYDATKREQLLLGYPLVVCDALPAPAAGTCPVLFGDFRKYLIGDRQQTVLQKLVELYAENDMVAFKGTRRTDGVLLDRNAVKALRIAD